MKKKDVTNDPKTDPCGCDLSHRPNWYRKLFSRELYGKRKDNLIVDILLLGGESLLETRCGLYFHRDAQLPSQKPTMKSLLLIKRNLEKRKKSFLSGIGAGEYEQLSKTDLSENGVFCEMSVWTPKTDLTK
jgi:hypothetical protein